jgi:hypothetical protein
MLRIISLPEPGDPQPADTSANAKNWVRRLQSGSRLGVLQDLKLRNRLNNVPFQLDHSRVILLKDDILFQPVEGVAEDVNDVAGNIGLLRLGISPFLRCRNPPDG